jgi:hypothetical protein
VLHRQAPERPRQRQVRAPSSSAHVRFSRSSSSPCRMHYDFFPSLPFAIDRFPAVPPVRPVVCTMIFFPFSSIRDRSFSSSDGDVYVVIDRY